MDKKDDETGNLPPLRHRSITSLWFVIKAKHGKKTKKPEEVKEVQDEGEAKKKMTRSKSVLFPSCSHFDAERQRGDLTKTPQLKDLEVDYMMKHVEVNSMYVPPFIFEPSGMFL
uniref:Uncharacterized protein n=1 Tax=Nelumbo nucifera TaxID=4432 RepID=A0A823A2U0_NELNU|nr:TPA_asm: hypothetical protein HUJ06_019153 [Nelumbo nucifera]